MKDTNREKNADPHKDRICRWDCLKSKYQSRESLQGNTLKFTSPTPWPRVEESAYRTFTVGVTHFVSAS